jgi:hypothetical protein
MAEIYNPDRLKQTESFRNGGPAVLTPTPKVTAMAPNAGEFSALPRPAIVPQVKYTQPAGTPVAPPVDTPSILNAKLDPANSLDRPETFLDRRYNGAIERPVRLNPLRGAAPDQPERVVNSNTTPVIAMKTRDLVARGSIASPVAASPVTSSVVSGPMVGPVQRKTGVVINGAIQPHGDLVDPVVAGNWNKQLAEDAYINKNPNSGVVFGASSNVPGTLAFDPGLGGVGAATTNEAISAIIGPNYADGKRAYDEAGIAAAKADPARQVHFVPRGPETRESAISGRFVRAPSMAERVAQVANQGAIDLAGVTGKTAVDVAAQNTQTAIETAKATEAEKTRRASEVAANNKYTADQRLEGEKLKAGVISSGAASKQKSELAALDADIVSYESSMKKLQDDNPLWLSKDQQAEYDSHKALLEESRAKKATLIGDNGKAMPGKTKPESTDEPEGTIIKNPKTGSRFVKKNGEWMPIK